MIKFLVVFCAGAALGVGGTIAWGWFVAVALVEDEAVVDQLRYQSLKDRGQMTPIDLQHSARYYGPYQNSEN